VPSPIYDLAVIGGGINGCGIARDAAGRGLSVFLCERDDLGGATSAASTKLIHGGLRYLEYYEFRLVHEALVEREILLRAAPHIIRPLRLILPHHAGLRPRWFLRLGLFVYDHLGGGRTLPATRRVDLRRDPAGAALKPEFDFAFEFSDCWADDSRLVVINAIDARARGATISPRTRCVTAERSGDTWRLTLERTDTGALSTVSARVLVNASGPWVGDVLCHVVHADSPAPVRLVKGSHIVVPRLFGHDRAYMFQNADGRIVFAIPYEQDFTLIGTTDQDFAGDPATAAAEPGEIGYLCATASEYFRAAVRPEQVVWSYSGVRPLYDDGASKAQEATRDYVIDLDAPAGQAPLLSVFGGKITTYRRLAEAALARLSGHLQMTAAWTATARLPGGDLPPGGAAALAQAVRAARPALSDAHVRRLVGAYGTRVATVLSHARRADSLGQSFGADLTEAEVDYLIAEEWARTAADVLWRRSKLGLRLTAAETAALEAWMARRRATSASGLVAGRPG
jgi:glycerol-3-phosphate dehydrogenase